MYARRILFALVPALIMVAAGLTVQAPDGAEAAPAAQLPGFCPVPAEQVDGLFVCIDRGDGALYREGDPIRICASVSLFDPFLPPPLLRVVWSTNGGPPVTVIEERLDFGQRCADLFIAPPFGREEIIAEVIDFDGLLLVVDGLAFVSAPRQGVAPPPAPVRPTPATPVQRPVPSAPPPPLPAPVRPPAFAPLPATNIVPQPVSAVPDVRNFTLVNVSPVIVDQVFVSPSDQVSWGPDILGINVLFPGESATIMFNRFVPGNCLYDIRIHDTDGVEFMLFFVDLCSITTVNFFG